MIGDLGVDSVDKGRVMKAWSCSKKELDNEWPITANFYRGARLIDRERERLELEFNIIAEWVEGRKGEERWDVSTTA